jgi:glycerophosphoryl diester phosphodiesterase
MSFTKVKIKYIIYILLFFAFTSIGIDVVFNLKGTKHDAPSGIWAHRGLHINHPQNSLEAFSAALKSGFEGVELDVFFYEDINQFIVSHDEPLSKQLDTFLTLESVFATFEDSLYYWLDLKNLNPKNYPAIKENLERLSSKYPIKEKLYIESANAIPLGKLAKAGFNTLYWVQYSRNQPKRFFKTQIN